MPILPFPTDLSSFVVWLGTVGAGGVIVALLLERIPQFKNWKSPIKSYAVLALFVALPFLAAAGQWALTALDPIILARVQWVVGTALTGLLAWGVSQYSHASDPAVDAPKVSPVTVVMAPASSTQSGPAITITTPGQLDSGMGASAQG